MTDCSNAEMRDQLPDLLHERLDEAARAMVLAHLSTCIDCDEELRLLRDVLGMIESRTPRIDVATIVSALPKPPVMTTSSLATPIAAAPVRAPAKVIPIAPRQRRWADWRIAAAVTLLVAGGSSAVLLNRDGRQTSQAPATVGQPPTASSTAAVTGSATAGGVPATIAAVDDQSDADLGNGSRLGDLTEPQLQTLLNEINKLPAVPVTDPEPVLLDVNARPTSSEGT